MFHLTWCWSFSILPSLISTILQKKKKFHCSAYTGADEPAPNLVPSLSAQREQTISATLFERHHQSLQGLGRIPYELGAFYIETQELSMVRYTRAHLKQVYFLFKTMSRVLLFIFFLSNALYLKLGGQKNLVQV